MVKEAGRAPVSASNSKEDKTLDELLAALLYYDQKKEAKETPRNFEEISETEQHKYIVHARKVLFMLDQLNRMVVPRVDPGQALKERMENVEKVKEIIQAFLPKVTKPPRVAKFFPVEELAIRIVEGRIK